MSKKLDDYGYFGPKYSFADNIQLPGDIGVRQEASVGAIMDALSGVNYYIDTIAFGGQTGFDNVPQLPMGIRYFLNSEMRCSNGATQSTYFDGITKGDLLGDRVKAGLASAGLPGLQGLAPGILENARDALDPRPILSAVVGTGYPVCQKVQCPVGTSYGQIANLDDPANPYIIDSVESVNGMPYQTRWVQAYDSDGSAISITKDEFAATPKCYNADGSYRSDPPAGCPATEPAPVNGQGQDNFSLCTVLQNATMPPTLQAASAATEGFTDFGSTEEFVILGASLAALSGVAVWFMSR
jgi:hypothetical protein